MISKLEFKFLNQKQKHIYNEYGKLDWIYHDGTRSIALMSGNLVVIIVYPDHICHFNNDRNPYLIQKNEIAKIIKKEMTLRNFK